MTDTEDPLFERHAEFCKMFSNPKRLRILHLLRDGERTVSEISEATGIAQPNVYFFGEENLDHNVRAAEVCPAKKNRGVIHVIDRRTDEEIAPDPHGDGTVSVDW